MLDAIRQCMMTALKLDAAAAARIDANTTASDVPGWTSVAHLSLILELERAFNVQFANEEIASLASVAAIEDALARKGVQ